MPEHLIILGTKPVKVETAYKCGLYAVDRRRAERPKLYVVTHTPTGASVWTGSRKADAVKAARHFHEHAGNAGAGANLGNLDSIPADEMNILKAAAASVVKR